MEAPPNLARHPFSVHNCPPIVYPVVRVAFPLKGREWKFRAGRRDFHSGSGRRFGARKIWLPGFWLSGGGGRNGTYADLQTECCLRPKRPFSAEQARRTLIRSHRSACGALILQMERVARQVCLGAGGDFVANNDGAARILAKNEGSREGE